MAARKHIVFSLKIAKTNKAEIKKMVRDAANVLNIVEFPDRKPKELSGENRRHFTIGCAIVHDPRVLFMGELF
ncbi:MAG: hypothetical protein HUJ51_00105 [Eggerthellaceae bacterium]|nr:hypothetical protein [Eggerthellaceae bacterium]